jgi:hypothetical protein
VDTRDSAVPLRVHYRSYGHVPSIAHDRMYYKNIDPYIKRFNATMDMKEIVFWDFINKIGQIEDIYKYRQIPSQAQVEISRFRNKTHQLSIDIFNCATSRDCVPKDDGEPLL